MKISRDVDGLRFIAEVDRECGFVLGEIECVRCGQPIDSHPKGRNLSLACRSCETTAKVFWSEVQMLVYWAENWNVRRQACTSPEAMAEPVR